jgi:hypothetical protein
MKRLLWKEWQEVKWYLAILLVGPWAFAASGVCTLGFLRITQVGSRSWTDQTWLDIAVLFAVIALWGATRIENGHRTHGFGLDWLPAKPWTVWAVKFLPGLMASILFPAGVLLAAHTLFHPEYGARHIPRVDAWDLTRLYLAVSIAAYCVSFAAATLLSTAASLVTTAVLVFIGFYTDLALFLEHHESWTLGHSALSQMTLIAMTVSLVVWASNRRSEPKKRWITATVTTFILCGILVLGFHRDVGRVFGGHDQEASYNPSETPRSLVDPVNTAEAYRVVTSMPKHQEKYELRVRTTTADVPVARANYVAPYAWVSNGNLIFGTTEDYKTMSLREWDRYSGKVTLLTRVESQIQWNGLRPIKRVIPNQDGTKAAMLILPYEGDASDLWVLDLKTHESRLICPGVSPHWDQVRPGQDNPAVWRGDNIIFYRSGEFWSIRSDGKDLHPLHVEKG